MRRFILASVALMIGSMGMASAQPQARTWTLSQCIDYALENNINIKQNKISLQQKEIALNTSKSNRLPGVSGGAGQNYSFGRSLTADNTYANTNTASTSFNLRADMTVFNGFRIKNDIAMSELNLEAATVDLEKAKDDIRVAVAQAYVQILYNTEILEVAKNQVALDEQQVERVEQLVRTGKASQVEVSAQRATLSQSQLSVTQAQNNLNIAILDLTQLLELPSPEGFQVVKPSIGNLQIGLLLDPETIYQDAIAIKPAIKAEEIRLNYADKSIAVAKSGRLPSISLSGGLGTNYYTSSGYNSAGFMDQMKHNFSQNVGVNLSVPIFSRFSNRNQIRNAQLSYNTQQLQLDNVKKSLYKEIQQAYYNAVAAEQKYLSSEAAAKSAEDAFDLMQAKYENGKASVTEYNESKARFVSASSDLAQARYQYLYQSRILDFYRGKPIEF